MENNQKEISLKNSLNEILNSSVIKNLPSEITISDQNNLVNNANQLPKLEIKKTNFGKVKKNANQLAFRTIDRLMKFYLSEHIISQEEYIQIKAKHERLNLSAILFQLKTAEKSIVHLMQTIENGEMTPRMFEVLASLQKSILDITRMHTLSMIAAEESFKRLAHDIDIYKQDSNIKNKAVQGTISSRGTKDLMKAIQNLNEQSALDNIETTEFNEI